jgi:LuxR family maltose regulon positive regulatory protein
MDRALSVGSVIISAPPGYGKTILAADWAQRHTDQVAWLTLDEHDNDLLTFNRYLKSLIETHFPQNTSAATDLPPEGNVREFFQTQLVQIINDTASCATDFTLVLDDYQQIHNPRIHEGQSFLLDHAPENLHLILISRVDPPFSLARLRAAHRILEIRHSDLAFTLAESTEFLNQSRSLQLSDQDIQRYYTQSEGWIAGLQLASLSKLSPVDIHPAAEKDLPDSNPALDYLVEEVIMHQPAYIQDFLLRTSILDNLYGPLCDHLLQRDENRPASQELLHNLYHSNMFLTVLDTGEHWFRYHALFSEALRHLLMDKYPAEITHLHLLASEWCDQNGMRDEALSYCQRAGDDSRLVQLLEKYSIEAISSSHSLDIFSYIHRSGDRLIATSPILSLVYAWGLILSLDIDGSILWLDRARTLLSQPESQQRYLPIENELWGILAAAESILAAARGDNDRAIEHSRQALRLLPEENSYAHSFALLNQGITLSINGKLSQAIDILHETIAISQRSGNWFVLMLARSNLAEILINCGKLSQAETLFNQSLHFLASTTGKFADVEDYIRRELGDIYLARNQLAEAGRCLLESTSKKPTWILAITDLDTHLRLAHLYHSLGDHTRCSQEIDLARHISVGSQTNLDDLVVDLYEVKFALQRGQVAPAQKWVRKMGLNQAGGQDPLKPYPLSIRLGARLVMARLLLVQGSQTNRPDDIQECVDSLRQILAELQEIGMLEEQMETHILLALSFHQLARVDEMRQSIRAAIELAEPEEFRQVFLDEGSRMAGVLNHFLTAIRQSRDAASLSARAYATDLLIRLTGKSAGTPTLDGSNHGAICPDLLTRREQEILKLLSAGCSNNELALQLNISLNTVKRHLNSIFTKLGVSTRTQAVRMAEQYRLL